MTVVQFGPMTMSKRRSIATQKHHAGHHSGLPGAITPQAQGDLLRRLWTLAGQLRDSRDADKVLSSALRVSREFFHADEGCVAVARPGDCRCDIVLASPPAAAWDADLVTELVRGHKETVPSDLMFARVRRRGRMWGAMFLLRPQAVFNWEARQAFSWVGSMATDLLERIDQARLREVRARIDRKILEQIAPKDLFYQILHGLESLVGYDHSAALLMCGDQLDELEIVAERVAWCKAKSRNIGLRIPLGGGTAKLLRGGAVHVFDYQAGRWCARTEQDAVELAGLLDYNPRGPNDAISTAENSILCAPLMTRHGVVGVLKLAAVHQGTFGAFDADVISQFLAQASVAIENLRRTEALAVRMRAAERELEEAREFQVTMLPPQDAQFKGMVIAANHLPCNQLAGDFYDYSGSDHGRIALVIADVVGHGASAAMLTGIVKATFHASRQDGFEPLAVIERLKYNLRSFDPSRFVTLTCAQIDASRHTLTYVNAGHPPAIVRRPGGATTLLQPTGPLVSSALSDYPFEAGSVRLEPGDSVLFYTDGLVDAWGSDGAFGQQRLVSLMEQEPPSGAALIEHLLGEVRTYSAGVPLSDDITILTLRLTGSDRAAGKLRRVRGAGRLERGASWKEAWSA